MKKIVTLLVLLGVVACDSKPAADYDTLENARRQANENASYNATAFRTTKPNAGELGILSSSDSSQTDKCPQGDGWETVKLVDKTSLVVFSLKCSTTSTAIGCLVDEEFKTKTYAQEDGKCNTSIPFPLPKLVK